MTTAAKTRDGFTLIELLVVIAISGILASLLLPAMSSSVKSAKTAACLSNLCQIGVALHIYVQDNENHLPVCPMIPSQSTNQTSIMATLRPALQNTNVFRCPADKKLFDTEGTSYEWNMYLNGASFDNPEDWSPVTQQIVKIIFNGKNNTPLIGDAESFHPARASWTGRNALYFDGRVEKSKMEDFSKITLN